VDIDVRDASELERGIATFAQDASGGMVVTASALAFAFRAQIVAAAAKHKLPAVYPARPFVTSGGLASYSPDIIEEYRLAAGYVDRIFKGEKPANLPVQNPTKYSLVINQKTATALGIKVAPTLLARADEVIE
jgi:putative tryptophan/tyrosine transport system substrate-binding protein